MKLTRALLCSQYPLLLISLLPAQDKILIGIYASYDSNKDKAVTRREFPGSNEQWAAMDRDKNGKVTFAEFEKSPTARRLLIARRKDAGAPRRRIDLDQLALARLDGIKRYDKNRDRRVTLAEWPGSPDAFLTLDYDRDGDLDRNDRDLAKRRSARDPKPTFPEFKSPLASAEALWKSLDKNRDQKLTRSEVRGNKLQKAFLYADKNRDEMLDIEELERVVMEINVSIAYRQRGYQKPRAYRVPFDAWDKNDDGRIETQEWQSVKYLFPRIDLNRDAAVTREEVARYIRSVEGSTFVERFDLNGDGRVTPKEFGGPADAFRRADRNGDGVVTRADH